MVRFNFDERIASSTVLFLLVFPSTLFLSVVYPESLLHRARFDDSARTFAGIDPTHVHMPFGNFHGSFRSVALGA
jgi:hypothetical protein